MTKKELLDVLKDLKDDEHINLFAWDKNDIWEIVGVSLNRYDSGENDLEFIMNEDYSIVNRSNLSKAIEAVEKHIVSIDIGDSHQMMNDIARLKRFLCADIN